MRYTGPFRLEELTDREWLVTNGLGGYASATLCGMLTRRYHGLLVAALHPPGQRTLLVAKLEETLTVGGMEHPLSTNQYPGVIHPPGYHALRAVSVYDDAVLMEFAVAGATLEKRVAMVAGENTTRVTYRNTGDTAYTLTLTPLVNARDFHGDTQAESINFQVEATRGHGGPLVHVRPAWMAEGYWLSGGLSGQDGGDGAVWQDEQAWYRNMVYCWEQQRGLSFYDNHFSPGHFRCELPPGETLTITLSTVPPHMRGVAAVAPAETATPMGRDDDPPEITRLYRTAQSFLVQRASVGAEAIAGGRTIIAGYHWFGDWGRDTMIALPGVCLSTGRFDDAAEILRTFAAARRRGLLPNLFLDSGAGEAYNAVDASLWYVYAVDRYYQLTGDRALLEELRPALEEIIHYYRHGTDFGIAMDARDSLINAAAPGWQLTWMDAKVGDWVVTPRMGKAVEINALWYNALRVMEHFAQAWHWPGDYGTLADEVRKHFTAFWNSRDEYLYDVLAEAPDARLRPNQIFAVSLPYSPLDLHQALGVVRTVERYLLTPYGLRTLAPRDAEYQGHYHGDQWSRDGAYHRGTVWAWLMGPYVEAYLRVHGHTAAAKATCRALLRPLLAHVWDAGVGSISEIFEGNPPHLPCGTISQAWSVAEVLRAWELCRA